MKMLRQLDEFERELENPTEEWITTQEAAEICKIANSTLSRLAKQNRCVAKKVGYYWRFPKSQVQDMSFLKEVV